MNGTVGPAHRTRQQPRVLTVPTGKVPGTMGRAEEDQVDLQVLAHELRNSAPDAWAGPGRWYDTAIVYGPRASAAHQGFRPSEPE
jgi:hypothetical protein